mmetsp:Transcript_8822/g.29799  ORF Transcript_8822/g.29799 Transcript_8822/m.29799 type:complete len:224 (+) Transcript_8822:559-1230(+)
MRAASAVSCFTSPMDKVSASIFGSMALSLTLFSSSTACLSSPSSVGGTHTPPVRARCVMLATSSDSDDTALRKSDRNTWSTYGVDVGGHHGAGGVSGNALSGFECLIACAAGLRPSSASRRAIRSRKSSSSRASGASGRGVKIDCAPPSFAPFFVRATVTSYRTKLDGALGARIKRRLSFPAPRMPRSTALGTESALLFASVEIFTLRPFTRSIAPSNSCKSK